MNNLHLTERQLEQLLMGEEDQFASPAVGHHLRQCDSCQQKLQALAAAPDTWSKASKYLKGRRDVRSSSISVRETDREIARIIHGDCESEPVHDTCDLEPADWLGPPRHPELMGSLGRYDIEREVGRGGMGIVYKAFDRELHRPLAIKVLSPHLAGQGTARKRFAQEAIAAAGIIHPNVISVHGVDHRGRIPYIVMHFVDGASLQTFVDTEGPMAEIEIIRVSKQIAAGLTAAHSQGLVHRDIKPANILIEAGVNRVLITDFGLARAEDDASMTQTGKLVGTLNYMSPEQAQGHKPDCRSDLFSLGSLMYFLATGRSPFRSERSLGVINRILNEEPAPIRSLNNQVSSVLEKIIQRLLQKDPEKRFQTSADLHEVLTQHLAHLHQPDILQPPCFETFEKPDAAKKKTRSARYTGRNAFLLYGLIALILIAVSIQISGVGKKIFYLFKNEIAQNQKVESRNFVDPKHGVLLIENGDNFLELGRYDRAAELYEESKHFAWCSGLANFRLACIWALKGEEKQAFRALRKAVDHGFTDSAALESTKLDLIRENKEFLEIVAAIREMNLAVHAVESAIGEIEVEKLEKAERVFRDVLKRDPSNEEAIVSIAYLLHRQNRFPEALNWHRKTIETKKYSPIGHYNLCCYYAIHDQPEEALISFETAIEHGLAYLLVPEEIRSDSDVDSIRSMERFRNLFRLFCEHHAKSK